jgi:hypothetical protein
MFLTQETHIWASTAYYGESFILLYVDDFLTSQETHLCVSTAYYGYGFASTYLLAAICPKINSASNRNEYQKLKNKVSGD